MKNNFDYIIIGKGMIGAAAARYVSQAHDSVALIGPDEPKYWSTHQGVFGSHYDQGRITRELDTDLVWGTLAKRSIEAYAGLEQASGITFHYPVGVVRVGTSMDDGETTKVDVVGQTLGSQYETFSAQALQTEYPHLSFPAEYTCLLERGQAGYVNPRSLVAAQINVAVKQGTKIFTDTVTKLATKKHQVEITTAQGQTLYGQRVLIAAGAYSDFLLENPPKLEKRPRTILMAEVSGTELERLQNLPAIIYYEGITHPDLGGIYALPPIQYPDGRTYIKIGGRMLDLKPTETEMELREWFQTGGRSQEASALKDILHDIIIDLKSDSFQKKACVTIFTNHGYPYIDTLDEGRLFIATGGCGAAAKSSNEIGRLGANLMMTGEWQDDLESEIFQAIYQA